LEEEIREIIRAEVEPLADEVKVDVMGNLCAVKKGSGDGLRVMLAAHMDEIGMIVTYIDKKGFGRFTRVGGVFSTTLIGNRVRFANGTIAAINVEEGEIATRDLQKLYLDFGATGREDCPVRVGDIGAFYRDCADLGKRMVAKSMDDRIGCAIQIEVMRALKKTPHDVHFVFTAQEEVGTRGATTSAFAIDPDMAIAVDVTTTGDTPEARPMDVDLGKGPAIKVMDMGSISHPAVKELMIRTAEENDIPYQLEVMTFGATDARAIQKTREGVPSGCLSIPCRHVHTNSEMVDYDDVQNGVKLLAAILSKPIEL
jgi:endoglucanase